MLETRASSHSRVSLLRVSCVSTVVGLVDFLHKKVDEFIHFPLSQWSRAPRNIQRMGRNDSQILRDTFLHPVVYLTAFSQGLKYESYFLNPTEDSE